MQAFECDTALSAYVVLFGIDLRRVELENGTEKADGRYRASILFCPDQVWISPLESYSSFASSPYSPWYMQGRLVNDQHQRHGQFDLHVERAQG